MYAFENRNAISPNIYVCAKFQVYISLKNDICENLG